MSTAGYVRGHFLSGKQQALIAALQGSVQVKLVLAPTGRRFCFLVQQGEETPVDTATVASLWRRGVLVQTKEEAQGRERTIWLQLHAEFREVA